MTDSELEEMMVCALCGYIIEGMGFICPKCHPSPKDKPNHSNNSNSSNELPWPKCTHTGSKEPGSFYETQKGRFVPEAEANELWELKKWNVPREQLQNSRGHVIELKEENQRLWELLKRIVKDKDHMARLEAEEMFKKKRGQENPSPS